MQIKIGLIALLVTALLSGCSKEPIKITSAELVDTLDKGSGNFDRMLKICFDKPLTSDYYHRIKIITSQSYKLEGDGILKPLASDPDARCHFRNLYNYINKDSPVGARQLIKDYMVPGNIHQLLIQVYPDVPDGKQKPMSQVLYKDL